MNAMTPERWQKIKAVLYQALELPPERRGEFLAAPGRFDADASPGGRAAHVVPGPRREHRVAAPVQRELPGVHAKAARRRRLPQRLQHFLEIGAVLAEHVRELRDPHARQLAE